jgi:hypothetical protein
MSNYADNPMIDTMKNFTRILILSCLISAGAGRSAAQQDVLLSQYMFNHMLINPAYAGNKDYTVSQLLYRRQWVGMEGAPETQIGSVHGRVGTKNLGWGALIGHDRIGATDRTDAYANGAYHLQVKDSGRAVHSLPATTRISVIGTTATWYSTGTGFPVSCPTSERDCICTRRNTMQDYLCRR